MTGDGWAELLAELDSDQVDADGEWGIKRGLDVGETLVGFWLGVDEWEGDYGRVPVYLMADEQGARFHFYGGRKQLDKRISDAGPEIGDRVAIRRLDDAPAEEGRSPAWRVRVAVKRGDGTIPGAATGDAEKPDDIPF